MTPLTWDVLSGWPLMYVLFQFLSGLPPGPDGPDHGDERRWHDDGRDEEEAVLGRYTVGHL